MCSDPMYVLHNAITDCFDMILKRRNRQISGCRLPLDQSLVLREWAMQTYSVASYVGFLLHK